MAEVKNRARQQKAAISWEQAAADMRTVFDSTADARWRDAFAPLLKGVVEDAAGHWTTETGVAAGVSFSVRNLEAEDWFNTHALQFATPINDTSEQELAALLQQADREGWTISATQVALTDVFNQWIHGSTDAADFAGERLPPYRTEQIARTVSMQSYSAGSQALFEDAGIKQKEWLATEDDRTRETHAEADGQVVDIDFPFIVGGFEMMWPGDGSLGADVGEIVNCRCSLLPVLESEDRQESEVNEEES